MPEPTRLASLADLDEAVEASRERPVFLFKHSLTCGISASAYRAFRSFADRRAEDALFALVEIQRARPVSTGIAERTGVRHESPQAILLRDGRPVWHASHWEIGEAALERALDRARG